MSSAAGVLILVALEQRQGGSCVAVRRCSSGVASGACWVVIGWLLVVHLMAQV